MDEDDTVIEVYLKQNEETHPEDLATGLEMAAENMEKVIAAMKAARPNSPTDIRILKSAMDKLDLFADRIRHWKPLTKEDVNG